MEEGRSQYHEDPRRRINCTLGLHAEILVRVVPKHRIFEKELKMAGDKNKHTIWAVLLSLLSLTTSFQQNFQNNQLVVLAPNEMVGLYCHDQPLNDPLLFLSVFPQYQDLPSEGSLHGARIFLLLGSSHLSARKILVLGRSQPQEQVQPFVCKPNTENIWRQDDPPSRIYLVLVSSSLHVNSPLVIVESVQPSWRTVYQ